MVDNVELQAVTAALDYIPVILRNANAKQPAKPAEVKFLDPQCRKYQSFNTGRDMKIALNAA